VCVVCYQVEVSATSCSLVQKIPTDSGASLCVINKLRDRGGFGPRWAAVSEKNCHWYVNFYVVMLSATYTRPYLKVCYLKGRGIIYFNVGRDTGQSCDGQRRRGEVKERRNMNDEDKKGVPHCQFPHHCPKSDINVIFCWPCINMYHNNVINLIQFHFHKHFNPLHVSGGERP
jgi:hypothetical protein